MALNLGDRLEHYVIQAPLGEGGMGAVYRAKDENLGRDVAIKILSEEFKNQKDRILRLEQEAKTLASLNHPNIMTIYDFITIPPPQSTSFLVMELIEGKDLTEHLYERSLSIQKKIDIARQIALGLEAAHALGIIHRDLKPSNIRITPDIRVKILDFGLAKEWMTKGDAVPLENSETRTVGLTQKGTIMGTMPYISPEQIQGQSIDRRCDIWAFGCVLYEMLAGKRAFGGDTGTKTLALILERSPDWEALPKKLPKDLIRVMTRCLEKDPNHRFRDAGDLALYLEDINLHGPEPEEVKFKTRSLKVIIPWLLIMFIIAFGILKWPGKPEPSFEGVLFFKEMSPVPIDLKANNHAGPPIALSPDGQTLVWVGAADENDSQLIARKLDEHDAALIKGTSGAAAPFFSPDGKWLGFWAGGFLKKISIDGGVPQTLCGIQHIHGPTWGQDVILMEGIGDSSLFKVHPEKAILERISTRRENGVFYSGSYPRYFGEPNLFLLTSRQNHSVDLINIDTLEIKPLLTNGSNATYLKSGYLLWVEKHTLYCAPFDRKNFVLTGEKKQLVEGILTETHTGTSAYYVAVNDTLAYVEGDSNLGGAQPVWVDLTGNSTPMPIPYDNYLSPRVSPNGQKILISRYSESQRIWFASADKGFISPITPENRESFWAIWLPGHEEIITNSILSSELYSNLWLCSVNSIKEPIRLTTLDKHQPPADITADGKTILIQSGTGPHDDVDIDLVHLGDTIENRPFLNSKADEFQPALSPDENWIAYTSNVTNQYEIYVERFPELGSKIRVSKNGGQEPLWSPKGDTLYYRSIDGHRVFKVLIKNRNPLEFGNETPLFEGNYEPGLVWGSKWDIHPDGNRFLMLKRKPLEDPNSITVIANLNKKLEGMFKKPRQ